jgi:hypothetical protein
MACVTVDMTAASDARLDAREDNDGEEGDVPHAAATPRQARRAQRFR